MRWKPGHEPGFSDEDREDIAKAVAIAGLTALVTKGAEWGIEFLRKKLTPELDESKCEKCDSKKT